MQHAGCVIFTSSTFTGPLLYIYAVANKVLSFYTYCDMNFIPK